MTLFSSSIDLYHTLSCVPPLFLSFSNPTSFIHVKLVSSLFSSYLFFSRARGIKGQDEEKNSIAFQLLPSHHMPSDLHSMDIISRDTGRHASLFDFCPAIAGIVLDQHKTLALRHGMLCFALCRVVIQSFYISQLLGTSLGRHRRALLP